MITKKEIIKMAKHVTRRDAGIPDRRLMHPLRDWLIGFVVAVILFGCFVFYAAYTYIEHTHFAEQTVIVERSVAPYDQEKIKNILHEYDARTHEFNTLRGVPVAPVEIEPETTTETEVDAETVAEEIPEVEVTPVSE